MSLVIASERASVENRGELARLCNWACLSVKETNRSSVEGVTVTVDLDGREPSDVWALAHETALRYGLRSSAVVRADHISLHFARRDAR